MAKIEIKADNEEQVICVKAIEDEGKYFCLLEITKEKYDEIKNKIEKPKEEEPLPNHWCPQEEK